MYLIEKEGCQFCGGDAVQSLEAGRTCLNYNCPRGPRTTADELAVKAVKEGRATELGLARRRIEDRLRKDPYLVVKIANQIL